MGDSQWLYCKWCVGGTRSYMACGAVAWKSYRFGGVSTSCWGFSLARKQQYCGGRDLPLWVGGGCQCLDSLDEWELRWCLSHLNSVLAPKVGISGKMVVLTTEFLPTPPKWLEVYRWDFSRVAIGFTFFMPYFMTSLRCQALSFFGQHGSSVGGDCPPAPWLLPLTPWLWLSVSSLFSLPLLNHHVWSLRMLQLQGQTCLPYKNSKWVNGG